MAIQPEQVTRTVIPRILFWKMHRQKLFFFFPPHRYTGGQQFIILLQGNLIKPDLSSGLTTENRSCSFTCSGKGKRENLFHFIPMNRMQVEKRKFQQCWPLFTPITEGCSHLWS